MNPAHSESAHSESAHSESAHSESAHRQPASRTRAKPLATLSIDLDDQWAYLRAAGVDAWAAAPSYLDVAVPRLVDTLGPLNLPLSVFLVGRDLEFDHTRAAISRLAELREVEYGNHSWNHLPWLHTMNPSEIHDEVARTHQAIVSETGQIPVGFRGPGFSCPDSVLGEIANQGYRYDASSFPTSMAPVARLVFLLRSDLRGAEREKAKKLYGGFSSMFRPNRPHRRQQGDHAMWELPVTTLPMLRTPIHFSYLLFLASKSVWLAKAYFTTALRLCRTLNTVPSLLLHPPDFLGAQDQTLLTHLPGMRWAREKKLSVVRWALEKLAESFDVWTLRRYVQFAAGGDQGGSGPGSLAPVQASV
ncbi:MAG: polysaccharide deacetylase family protein [Planctomycetota bacterium]